MNRQVIVYFVGGIAVVGAVTGAVALYNSTKTARELNAKMDRCDRALQAVGIFLQPQSQPAVQQTVPQPQQVVQVPVAPNNNNK